MQPGVGHQPSPPKGDTGDSLEQYDDGEQVVQTLHEGLGVSEHNCRDTHTLPTAATLVA